MIAALVFLVFYPTVQLISTSLPDGSIDAYRSFFNSGPGLRALKTTLWVSGLVTLITLICAGVMAWAIRTARSRAFAALCWLAVLLPLAMSTVVQNFAWITILSRFGALNWVLNGLHLPSQSLLFTPGAVVLGMVNTLFPFAVFPLYATFVSIPTEMLHAAESMGAGRWQRVTTVILPLSLPGFFITGVLIFVLSIGFYVTPIVLGGPRSTFMAALIASDLQQRFDPVSAAASAVIMMAIALLIVTISVALVGRDRFQRALA
jgi:putative spermidine/putrescine transport system permease protein